MKKIQGDLEILIVPVGILVVIGILIIVVAKVIIDNISTLNGQLGDNQKTESMLEQKLASLQKVTQRVSNDSSLAATALPGTNSALTAVGQIQSQAQSFNLVLSNLNSESSLAGASSNINSTEIDFDADGNLNSISDFIDRIKNSVPINRFSQIRITNTNATGSSLYRLSASVLSYWSPLPSTIPAINSPIEELTADEQKVLSQISTLNQTVNIVSSSSSGSVSVGVGKSNPFQ